jgi:hypothetical protein
MTRMANNLPSDLVVIVTEEHIEASIPWLDLVSANTGGPPRPAVGPLVMRPRSTLPTVPWPQRLSIKRVLSNELFYYLSPT